MLTALDMIQIQDTPELKRQLWRLTREQNDSASLIDPEITAKVLRQVKEELAARGVEIDG